MKGSVEHTYKGYKFEILYGLNKFIGDKIKVHVQECEVFIETNRGTWHHQIDCTIEFLEDPIHKDHLCDKCLNSYIDRNGSEPFQRTDE